MGYFDGSKPCKSVRWSQGLRLVSRVSAACELSPQINRQFFWRELLYIATSSCVGLYSLSVQGWKVPCSMCWPSRMSSHEKSNIAAPFLPFWKSEWIYGCSCVCSKAGTTTPTLSAVGQLRGRKAWCNLWYVIHYHFAAPWKMNFRKFWADGKGEHWENPGISKSIVLCWQKDTVTTHFSCQLAAVTQSIMVGCWITSQWNSAWRVILVLHGLWDKRGMNRPPGRGSTPSALIKVPIKKSNGTGNGKLASSACYRS